MRYLICVILFSATSCSFLDSKSSSRSSGDDDPNANTIAINPLAESFPEGLSVSVFATETAASTTTGTLAVDSTSLLLSSRANDFAGDFSLISTCTPSHPTCTCSHREQITFQPLPDHGGTRPDIKQEHASKKIAAARKRLRGEESQCASDDLLKAIALMEYTTSNGNLDRIYCYEFDWGLEHGYQVDKHGVKVADAEPCLVAFTRSEVASGQSYIDFATQLSETLLCQSKKDGVSLELKAGEAYKFDTNLKKALEGRNSGMSVSKAQIARLNDQGGKKVFRTDIELTRTHPEKKDSRKYEIHVVHSPQNDENTAYQGNVWIKHDLEAGGTNAKVKAMNLSYVAKVETGKPRRVKFEQRMGEFLSTTNPFDAKGFIDFNQGAESDGQFAEDKVSPPVVSDQNKHLSNMKYLSFDGYPTDGVMNFSYWRNPGQNYNENARGFIFNVTRTDTGEIKGCGIAGAAKNDDVTNAISIRQALKTGVTLQPKGYLRPFMCHSGGGNDPANRHGPKVWRQCFKQQSDGKYAIEGPEVEFLDVNDSKVSAIKPPAHDELRKVAEFVDPENGAHNATDHPPPPPGTVPPPPNP